VRERRRLIHTCVRLNQPPFHSPMRRTTHTPRPPSHHRLQDRAQMFFVRQFETALDTASRLCTRAAPAGHQPSRCVAPPPTLPPSYVKDHARTSPPLAAQAPRSCTRGLHDMVRGRARRDGESAHTSRACRPSVIRCVAQPPNFTNHLLMVRPHHHHDSMLLTAPNSRTST